MNLRPEGRSSYGPLSSDHMRLHYSSRCDESTRRNLRDVSSRIAVAVREDSTDLAREPMPPTYPQLTAHAARLRGVRRIDVHHGESGTGSLILHKLLQLPPRPAVQPRAQALPGFDPCADMPQVLHSNRPAAAFQRFANDRGADLVIDVAHVARLSAGDAHQQLLCRLRAVACKSPAQCQKPIAGISKFSTSKQPTTAGCSSHVLTQIDPEDIAPADRSRFRQIEHDMQIPAPSALHQLRLAKLPAREILALESPRTHRHTLPTNQREDRHRAVEQPVGASIDMHRARCRASDTRPRSPVGSVRLQSARHRRNCITCKLRSQRGQSRAQSTIGQMVQPHPVGHPVLQGDWSDQGTCGAIDRPQICKLRGLLVRRHQTYRNRALHTPHSHATVCHASGTLKIPKPKKEGRFLPGLKAAVSAPTF